MEGWRFIMDVGMATVVAVLLSSVLSFIFNTWVDNRGWKKVEEKIGDTSKGGLNIQHEDIKNVIVDKTKDIEKINEITVRNEGLYQNLNLDQREVRNSMDKLLFEWQNLALENKGLKKEIQRLEEHNITLVAQNAEILKNNKRMHKKVELAEQILDISKKPKDYREALEDEDEWEPEI